jgi:hypothetical protein
MVTKLRRVAAAPVKSRGASVNLRREARSPSILSLVGSSRGLLLDFLTAIEGADVLAEVISELLYNGHDLGRSWCRYR